MTSYRAQEGVAVRERPRRWTRTIVIVSSRLQAASARGRPANRAAAMANPQTVTPRRSAWASNECTVARTVLLVSRFTQMVPKARVSGSAPAASSTATLPLVSSGALTRPMTATAGTACGSRHRLMQLQLHRRVHPRSQKPDTTAGNRKRVQASVLRLRFVDKVARNQLLQRTSEAG